MRGGLNTHTHTSMHVRTRKQMTTHKKLFTHTKEFVNPCRQCHNKFMSVGQCRRGRTNLLVTSFKDSERGILSSNPVVIFED